VELSVMVLGSAGMRVFLGPEQSSLEPGLLRALESQEYSVRKTAIWSLVSLRSAAAVPALAKIATEDSSVTLQLQAGLALLALGRPEQAKAAIIGGMEGGSVAGNKTAYRVASSPMIPENPYTDRLSRARALISLKRPDLARVTALSLLNEIEEKMDVSLELSMLLDQCDVDSFDRIVTALVRDPRAHKTLDAKHIPRLKKHLKLLATLLDRKSPEHHRVIEYRPAVRTSPEGFKELANESIVVLLNLVALTGPTGASLGPQIEPYLDHDGEAVCVAALRALVAVETDPRILGRALEHCLPSRLPKLQRLAQIELLRRGLLKSPARETAPDYLVFASEDLEEQDAVASLDL
jgi:hypothetical protein